MKRFKVLSTWLLVILFLIPTLLTAQSNLLREGATAKKSELTHCPYVNIAGVLCVMDQIEHPDRREVVDQLFVKAMAMTVLEMSQEKSDPVPVDLYGEDVTGVLAVKNGCACPVMYGDNMIKTDLNISPLMTYTPSVWTPGIHELPFTVSGTGSGALMVLPGRGGGQSYESITVLRTLPNAFWNYNTLGGRFYSSGITTRY